MQGRDGHESATATSQAAAKHPQAKSNGRAEEGHLRSRVIKRSLVVGGHKTSVSLEEVFWLELRAIAHNRKLHLSQLVGSIDEQRQHCNLSSAIRLFVFEHCRDHSKDAPVQVPPARAEAGQSPPRRP